MKPKIALTGGGTAGHVTPNLALIEELKADWEIYYLGSEQGIEANMIAEANVPFHAISSGKLRRYFSWKNFIDPFKITLGIVQSYFILRKIKPQVLFSKGGFVSFPVVVAAWFNRIPILIHESDMSPGLANRLSFPFATKICLAFEAASKNIKDKQKIEVTGTPIRKELFHGDKKRGLERCGFNDAKPCLLIIGGSQGSQFINQFIRTHLAVICEHYQVIHICGKGKINASLMNYKNYYQLEYANIELADLLAASNLVISRSGANTLCELLALAKPHILIPLSKKVSRGDQIENAVFFQKKGISIVIFEEELTKDTLLTALDEAMVNQQKRIENIRDLELSSATQKIMMLIKEEAFVNDQPINN